MIEDYNFWFFKYVDLSILKFNKFTEIIFRNKNSRLPNMLILLKISIFNQFYDKFNSAKILILI